MMEKDKTNTGLEEDGRERMRQKKRVKGRERKAVC